MIPPYPLTPQVKKTSTLTETSKETQINNEEQPSAGSKYCGYAVGKDVSDYGGDLRLTLDIFNLFNTAYPLAVDADFESEEFGVPTDFSSKRNSVGVVIRFKCQIP